MYKKYDVLRVKDPYDGYFISPVFESYKIHGTHKNRCRGEGNTSHKSVDISIEYKSKNLSIKMITEWTISIKAHII